MLRKSLLVGVLLAGLSSGLTLTFPAARASSMPADAGDSRPAAIIAMGNAGSYTVWYRWGNGRWHGVTGLSYYDACSVLDSYLRAGYQAYIE